jgi:cytochrome bd-type quinol oxidase subunit 2
MSNPFYWFLLIVVVLLGGAAWAVRDTWASLRDQLAYHAKNYALSYVKCAVMVFIGMATSFREAFKGITAEMAAHYTWFDWACIYFLPLIAGANVLSAFLDQSVAKANEKRVKAEASGEEIDPAKVPVAERFAKLPEPPAT